MRNLVYKLLIPFSRIEAASTSSQLRVLAYHDVPNVSKFEQQLIYLKNNYNVIDLETLKLHLKDCEPLPNNSLLITFDDGDISVLENGLSLLYKYNLPSILFIITSLINTKDMFWCRKVEAVFQEAGNSYFNARQKVRELKNMPNVDRMNYLNGLRKVKSRQLSLEDLYELEEGKMLIANHTHTHPMMDMCTDEEIMNELEITYNKFKGWGLDRYSIFAYPNGNWDAKSEELLKNKGIKMAFLFDHKINKLNINPMRISRIRINSDTEINEFKVKVSGLHSKLMKLKEGIS